MLVGPEIYFHHLIEGITGCELPNGSLQFHINNGIVAELDRGSKGDILWLHWTVFYLPFIKLYQMKESQVNGLIKKHLNVAEVSRYPSALRLIIVENMEKHMELFDLLDCD